MNVHRMLCTLVASLIALHSSGQKIKIWGKLYPEYPPLNRRIKIKEFIPCIKAKGL